MGSPRAGLRTTRPYAVPYSNLGEFPESSLGRCFPRWLALTRLQLTYCVAQFSLVCSRVTPLAFGVVRCRVHERVQCVWSVDGDQGEARARRERVLGKANLIGSLSFPGA